jgi:hypothetical protein
MRPGGFGGLEEEVCPDVSLIGELLVRVWAVEAHYSRWGFFSFYVFLLVLSEV